MIFLFHEAFRLKGFCDVSDDASTAAKRPHEIKYSLNIDDI